MDEKEKRVIRDIETISNSIRKKYRAVKYGIQEKEEKLTRSYKTDLGTVENHFTSVGRKKRKTTEKPMAMITERKKKQEEKEEEEEMDKQLVENVKRGRGPNRNVLKSVILFVTQLVPTRCV